MRHYSTALFPIMSLFTQNDSDAWSSPEQALATATVALQLGMYLALYDTDTIEAFLEAMNEQGEVPPPNDLLADAMKPIREWLQEAQSLPGNDEV